MQVEWATVILSQILIDDRMQCRQYDMILYALEREASTASQSFCVGHMTIRCMHPAICTQVTCMVACDLILSNEMLLCCVMLCCGALYCTVLTKHDMI